jgi:ppGpp synthetase/RelA/SpoT-type nucleotidyltranferase
MMQRTVEDRLREEYFLLSEDIKRVLHELRTDVTYLLLPATLGLKHHERIQIEARAKECDSAIDSLRRREETRQFGKADPEKYSLTNLPDLVGLRVMVFPRLLLEDVHTTLLTKYGNWTPDPVRTRMPTRVLARKYHGFCSMSPKIRAEIQILPMLTGLFWHVEHDAFYKPRDAVLKGAAREPVISNLLDRIYDAFDAFENALELEMHNTTAP